MNQSINSSIIPQCLKDATVVPIFKGGDKTLAKNYRPVSLTSHIIKIMERVITENLIDFLEQNFCISDVQHGFRSRHSTMSELLNHYHHIVNALDNNDYIDVVMLDYSKAFDKVSHPLLLKKLRNIGINGKLGAWIGHFLLKRRQRVKVNGILSDIIEVMSGVPQGSILGPLLFLIYINNLYSVVKNSNVSIYADDTKLSKHVSNYSDHTDLQLDLNAVYDWSKNNCMSFNTEKLELIRFTSCHSTIMQFSYKSPTGNDITEVETSKDLGIFFLIMTAVSNFISLKK